MLIEAIFAYLGAIVGPDRQSWKLWLGIVVVGFLACGVIATFR